MTAIRKLGLSALVLAAFAGCAQEPEAPMTPPSTSAPATTTTAPEATPPVLTAPADMKPAETDKAAATTGTAAEPPQILAPLPTPATKGDEPKPDAKGAGGDAAAAGSATLSGEEVAEIKKLPEGEVDKALKQLVCPVSDEHLGSMGMPVKVTAAGQTFYLCCKGCKQDVTDDPAAVVAKLKK